MLYCDTKVYKHSDTLYIMVLVQVEVDKETDKKIKQFMLDNEIEVKAKAIMCLAKMQLNEVKE